MPLVRSSPSGRAGGADEEAADERLGHAMLVAPALEGHRLGQAHHARPRAAQVVGGDVQRRRGAVAQVDAQTLQVRRARAECPCGDACERAREAGGHGASARRVAHRAAASHRPSGQARATDSRRRRRKVSPLVRLPQMRIEHHWLDRLREVS
jgi:hypothetical protein